MSLFPKFRPAADSLATPATPATPPPQSSKSSDSSSPSKKKRDKNSYGRAAASVYEDCLAIDPIWLAERYPNLWQHMASIDTQLTEMEQQGRDTAKSEMLITKLVDTVKHARRLHDTERHGKKAIQ